MNRFILRLLPLLMFTGMALAQPAPDTLWTRVIGDSLRDRGNCVRQTSDGGFIVAGAHGIGIVTHPRSDFYLLKFNASGDTQWTRNYGWDWDARACDVRETQDGGYFIGGYNYIMNPCGSDFYLIRTDARGDTLWTRIYATPIYESVCSMDITSDGGCILAGDIEPDSNIIADIYVVKVDSAGEVQWTFRWEDEEMSEYTYCIRQTLDGGYIMTGISIIESIDDNDCFLAKLSADGRLLWKYNYDFNAQESGHGVCEVPGEGYVIAGYTQFINFTVHILPDILLIRTNYQGDVLWTRQYGSDEIEEAAYICATLDDGFVVTGTSQISGFSRQLSVYKFNSNGDSLWAKHLGGINRDHGNCIQQVVDGSYIIAGSYGANNGDVYLVRIGSDIVPQVTITLTPSTTPVQIPAGGGAFQFDVSLVNLETQTIFLDIWTNAVLPTGRLTNTLLGPVELSLAPNGRLFRNLTQSVPSRAPAGEYRYVGYVGEYPDLIWEESSFPLTKLDGDALLNCRLGWTCYGWDEDEEGFRTQDSGFRLLSINPNPFNTCADLSFKLQAASNTKLAIYDIMGREVAVLAEGFYSAGTYQAVWDASGMTSGVYFAMLSGRDINAVEKMIMLK